MGATPWCWWLAAPPATTRPWRQLRCIVSCILMSWCSHHGPFGNRYGLEAANCSATCCLCSLVGAWDKGTFFWIYVYTRNCIWTYIWYAYYVWKNACYVHICDHVDVTCHIIFVCMSTSFGLLDKTNVSPLLDTAMKTNSSVNRSLLCVCS